MSQSQTGVDLISADNSTNSLGNRQTNPITIPSGLNSAFSYEKFCLLRVDGAPANFVQNFKAWSSSAAPATGVTVRGEGQVTSYTTPVSTERGGATAMPTSSGTARQWDSNQYSSVAQVTQFLVLQYFISSSAGPGNVPQVTMNFSYDEL